MINQQKESRNLEISPTRKGGTVREKIHQAQGLGMGLIGISALSQASVGQGARSLLSHSSQNCPPGLPCPGTLICKIMQAH